MAFTRADREWFFDSKTCHVAYGEIEWNEVNGAHRGTFTLAETPGNLHTPEFLFMMRPQIPFKPSLVVNLAGDCLARVDINGAHREGREVRSFTHRQIHHTPGDQAVVEALPDFPPVPAAHGIEFHVQMWMVLDAAAPYLNLDISGVDRVVPFPFDVERRPQ